MDARGLPLRGVEPRVVLLGDLVGKCDLRFGGRSLLPRRRRLSLVAQLGALARVATHAPAAQHSSNARRAGGLALLRGDGVRACVRPLLRGCRGLLHKGLLGGVVRRVRLWLGSGLGVRLGRGGRPCRRRARRHRRGRRLRRGHGLRAGHHGPAGLAGGSPRSHAGRTRGRPAGLPPSPSTWAPVPRRGRGRCAACHGAPPRGRSSLACGRRLRPGCAVTAVRPTRRTCRRGRSRQARRRRPRPARQSAGEPERDWADGRDSAGACAFFLRLARGCHALGWRCFGWRL